MKQALKEVSLAFTAGAFGGFVNRVVVWFFGAQGINAALGVKLAPALSEAFLYAGIVWGGLWGGLFLLPYRKNSFLLRGIVFSIFPTLVMLFIVYPYSLHRGVMGLELGVFTPALVVFFNSVWGIAAALWLKIAGK